MTLCTCLSGGQPVFVAAHRGGEEKGGKRLRCVAHEVDSLVRGGVGAGDASRNWDASVSGLSRSGERWPSYFSIRRTSSAAPRTSACRGGEDAVGLLQHLVGGNGVHVYLTARLGERRIGGLPRLRNGARGRRVELCVESGAPPARARSDEPLGAARLPGYSRPPAE